MSRLRSGSAVAVIEEDGFVYAASLPDGPIVVLDAVAAAIWTEARRGGERSAIPERLAEGTGIPAASIRDNVEILLDDLLRSGILEVDPE